jgi:glutamate synthase (NADPH/NADH) large chain
MRLFREWAKETGVDPAGAGQVCRGDVLPAAEAKAREIVVKQFEHFIKVEGQKLLGWRDVPTDPPDWARPCMDGMPVIRQAIIAAGPRDSRPGPVRAQAAAIRKQTQNPLATLAKKHKLPGRLAELYMPSLSTRTVVYKGLLLAHDVGRFYRDLQNPLTVSAVALVHQRFSTNTFPSWKLAHPYRFIAHNGEINTVRGNVNWINARRRSMESELLGRTSTRCGR